MSTHSRLRRKEDRWGGGKGAENDGSPLSLNMTPCHAPLPECSCRRDLWNEQMHLLLQHESSFLLQKMLFPLRLSGRASVRASERARHEWHLPLPQDKFIKVLPFPSPPRPSRVKEARRRHFRPPTAKKLKHCTRQIVRKVQGSAKRLRESRLLAPSDHLGRVHAT